MALRTFSEPSVLLTDPVQLELFYKHFCSCQSSTHHNFQTVRARDRVFLTMFTTPCVSHVICRMSPVTCNVSHFLLFLLLFGKQCSQLVDGVLSTGLPHLFFYHVVYELNHKSFILIFIIYFLSLNNIICIDCCDTCLNQLCFNKLRTDIQ